MTIRLAGIGPPGTGKTFFALSLVEQWIAQGVPTQRIGYLAFTKSAADEAASRVSGGRFDAEDYPYFRTIHSLCYRLMREGGAEGRVMSASDMKKFSKETGLDGEYAIQSNEDLSEAYQSMQMNAKSVWDNCRTAYSLSRISSRTVEDLDRSRVEISQDAICRMGWSDADAYLTFVQKYEAFKVANHLIDFTDMLEYPLRNRCETACRKVIVDEGQDFFPLAFSLISRLFDDSADELWYIGDDDQAIFGFSGASAEEFLAQIGNCRKVILRQTHRFGQGIVDFSERIVGRVKNRIVKDVIGKAGSETIITETGEFEPPEGDSFILHRHVSGCQEIGARLISAGVPFTNERGRSPLSSVGRIKAFKAMNAFADGGKVWFGSAVALVEDLLPSIWVSDDGTQKTRFIVHGAKKRIAEMPGNFEVTLADLVAKKILTEDGAAVVSEKKYEALKHASDLRYYEKVAKNGYELAPGGPTITTIHGSKGREADHVLVFTEASKRCWTDPDNEHRLAYVAVTRSKRAVTVCHQHLLDWTPMAYDYPISEEVGV